MIDNLLKEGGGILRRLPSAAMAIMLAVTLAIPQGLALADPAPVSEDVEAFGHANSEAQPVISESNTSTEMADKGDGLEQEVTPDQETQPDNPKEENPVSKEPDEDSESIKNEASDVEEEAEQPVDPLLLASQAPPVMGSIARDLSTISGTASMVCLNPGPTNDHYNRFGITMPDGQYLIGHCMDYGQAAPADGTYNFTGVWDSGARAYNVTLDTTGANKNPGSLAPYPCQRVGNFYWTPKGSVELYKSSTKPDMTNGNPVYSLSGAKYDVYRSNDDGYVLTLTTNASGYASASGLPYGNYYCVESQPPTGFFKDTSRHYFDVSGNAVIRASDVPYDDPVGALLHKADPLTGGTAQGGGTLGGAEFTVKYYAGYYSSDPAAQGISPMRTWVMRTDSDGFCYFDSSYVVSGDPFYIGAAGTPTFPLGTVTVQETKAPEGYVLSSAARPNDVFVQRITMSGIEGNPAEVWNEHQFLDDSIRGGVKTTKLDGYYQSATAQGDGTMQGATFAIKNASENPVVVGGVTYEPGKDVATITSGADGVAQTASDLLPYGTYELRETVPPEGYLLSDEVWRFEIREDGVVVEATTEQSIDNQVIRGGVKTAKLDHQSQTSVPQGSASVEGAVFAIKSVSANPVLVDGIVYEPGKDVATITSGADGVAQTASDLLPYGTYELRETVPPEGYLLSDEVWRFEIREDGKVVEATTEQAIDDQVKAAECFIIKVGTKIGDDVTEGDKADAIPLPGVEFSIYASKDFVDNGDGTYTVRDGAAPYATIVTDENGIADTSYNPRPDDQHGALPYDDYLVIETGPKPNYDPIEPFTFSAREDKKVYHFFANNTYVTAGVELVKVDAESGLPVLVAGTQLQVLDASKTPIVWHETYPEAISYDTLTVGDTGRVYLPQKLNAGSYYLREVSAPEGYLLGHADVPFTVSTTTDWDDPLVVEYANMPQKGSVKAMKVDAETGEPVPAAGIEFDLVAASDIKTGDGVVHVPAGEIAAHIVTAADGTATAEDLYLGSYRIVETLAPDGYVLNGEPVDVTLSYAGQEVEAAYAESEFGDVPQKGIIEAHKVDAESGLPVAVPGIEFRVTAAADVVTPDGTVRAHEGDVVAEVVTGDDGKAETPELYLGRYEVEETLAPDGYVLNGEPVDVTLSYAGQEVAVTRAGAVVEDAPQKGVIEIVKTDEADGRAVPGAVYEVTAAADIVTPDGTVHASSGDVVATVTTGDDGKAETDELYLGDYNVRETATPDGWAIDHETHMVELSYAGQEVKVTRTVLETADAPTTFILLKKAELIDGELVDYAGSEWHVWAEDAAGEIAYDATATTGEDGNFVLERIPHGDGLAYYCQETKTGDDYILDPEVYEFSVDEEGLIAGEPAYVFLNTNYHKRIIEAHKVDQDTGEPVGKTGFGLYRWIGEGEPDPTFGGRQGFHGVFADDPDGEVDGSLWEMVAEGTTDDMGAVIFEGLEFGWYMMVEAVPNPDYAEWWESAGSTWGRYLFKADKDSDVRQTQTYGNMAISLECNVSKATIDRTSAAFQSDERAPVRVDNVGKERYRYDVAFDAGSTNVRADQYAVVDPCEFVNLGIRLDTLVTPAAYGDTDGLVNVWYRTNMTDTSAVYSTASATAGNPPNQMADGTDRIGTVGWRLWREGVAAGARTRLDVDGLGLAAGEYVTGIMLEYGSVEVGFRTLQDMSYLVYATEPLDNSNGEVVIPNSVTSHITRNWRDGQGLYDDAHDNVITRVIDTFGFASSYHGFSTGTAGNGGALTATGDRVPALEGVAMLLAAVAAVLLGIWATRREEGEGA